MVDGLKWKDSTMAKKKDAKAKVWRCPMCNHGPLSRAGVTDHCKRKHGKTLREAYNFAERMRDTGKKAKAITKKLLKQEVVDGELVLTLQLSIPFSFGMPKLSEVA